MKLIIDTNVLVSAFAFGGKAGVCLNQVLYHPNIQIVISADIKIEYADVFQRDKFKKIRPAEHLRGALKEFLDSCILAKSSSKIDFCRDQDDNKFLELAVSVQADVVLTGDQDLLTLHPFEGIEILNLTDFQSKYL